MIANATAPLATILPRAYLGFMTDRYMIHIRRTPVEPKVTWHETDRAREQAREALRIEAGEIVLFCEIGPDGLLYARRA